MMTYRTRRRTGVVDPVNFAGDDGWLCVREDRGVAGRGLIARAAPSDVLARLGAISAETDSDPLGPGPVAIGARPFRPNDPWELAICASQLHVDDDGTAWEVTVNGGTPAQSPAARPSPPNVSIEQVDDPDTWCAAVATATSRIRAGQVEKVVLSREIIARSDVAWSPALILRRLRSRFPMCYLFSVDGLVGASPELLVSRVGDTVRAQPMAGTARRDRDPVVDKARLDELFASTTYRHEHQVTIDMVHDTLLTFSSYVDEEPEPQIVKLSNVAHLATKVEGKLSHPPASVLDLVEALHPTPAVCGRPRDAALATIEDLEPRDRGLYAGTVGWVDAVGNGTWAVSLRCAQIDPRDRRMARIQAGCGLVADSDPRTELAESEAKLQAMRSVLVD